MAHGGAEVKWNSTSQTTRREAKGPLRRKLATQRLETRQLLAADPIHVGLVYLETDYLESDQDVGSDSRGDRFILSFSGGAPDTELTELRVVTDKDGDGISVGDPIFDTEVGGRGKNGAHGFQVVRVETGDGRQVDATAEVEDGGQELVLRLSNFRAGDRLEFTVDVDEVLRNAVDLAVFNDRLDVITSGQEFQDSILYATFDAPHYETSNADAVFLNDYGDPATERNLNIPPDEGDNVDSRPNRSAAAVASTQQTPKPISISGNVWVDNDLDMTREVGEQLLANIELALWQLNETLGEYVDTGFRAETDSTGYYEFAKSLELQPGVFQVIQTQPAGLYSVGAVPGSVDGVSTGSAVDPNTIAEIIIPLGDQSSINNDFAEAVPSSIEGYVYRDDNDNGSRDAGEVGIAGVQVRLLPIQTIAPQSTLTVTTNEDGSYAFEGLAPGKYEVIEIQQPPNLTDGKDAAGTIDGQVVGVADNPGDRIREIMLAGDDHGIEYNFGELALGSLGGFVYLAAPGADCTGDHDAEGNTPIAGARVQLQSVEGIVVAEVTTASDGSYMFDDVPRGLYRIVQFTPNGLLDGNSHVGVIDGVQSGQAVSGGLISEITLTPGGVGTEYNFCEIAPATISGYVYHDQSNDGSRDAGEEGIAGSTVSLVDSAGNIVATATTDANGRYEFDGIEPGDYSLVQTQPDGFYDGIDSVGFIAGLPVGVLGSDGDSIGTIAIKQGQVGTEYNFGELRGASLSGRVHSDTDGDCEVDPGEQLLSGVRIRLLNEAGQQVAETVTDNNGRYTFENLEPGTYTVVQEQPEGFFAGDASVGSAGGIKESANRIGTIELGSGEVAVEYDFCENPPAEIFGSVFSDTDGDCLFEAHEEGIEGVLVELYDANNQLIASTTTNAAGHYHFSNLPAGNYTIREVQPAGWLQGGQRAGSAGGDDSVQDQISMIAVGWGERLTQYNFCEIAPSRISGFVHVDADGDCVHDEGERPLPGVRIDLLDADGNVIASTMTDSQGQYSFENLRPGDYRIFQHQPDGFFHGGQRLGTGGGQILADDLLGLTLAAGSALVEYNFCEIEPSSISGIVHIDEDGDCIRDEGERGLGGVRIDLMDVNGNLISTTVTDSQGQYSFENLRPGDYRIFQHQPDGLLQGGQTLGSGGGLVLADDLLGVTLAAGRDLVDYNFCEVEPSSISGFVHVDDDGDCIRDANEQGLAGVTIELRDATGRVVAQTMTDSNGRYEFTNLRPGDYQIFEYQPEGYFQGSESLGSGGGSVLGQDLLAVGLAAGTDLVDYNFCELAPASVSGLVWSDPDLNQQYDPGDMPLPGVLIELLNHNDEVVQTTTTNPSGEYSFDQLRPGRYSVRQSHPEGYFQGGQMVGSAGGQVAESDWLVGIDLGSGENAVEYNFFEVPPASISGFVFQDGGVLTIEQPPAPSELRQYRDGKLTADDVPIPGVTIELRTVLGGPFFGQNALPGVYPDGPIQAVTDADGFYQLVGLRPGSYHLYQVQPDGFVDGLDSAGTTGGTAINVADEVDNGTEIVIQRLSQNGSTDPGADAILNVALLGNQTSEFNNFSEIAVVAPPTPPNDFLDIIEKEAPARPAPIIETFDPRIRIATFASPVIPPPPVTYVDEWAVSWHLSVINGGYPRGDTDEGIVKAAAAKANIDWVEGDYNRGTWRTVNSDGELTIQEDMMLGAKDATAVSGDFNGDGIDEVGLYLEGHWLVDLNSNGRWDQGDLWISLGTYMDRPVVGDWDGDGKDDVGIFGRQWQRDPQKIKRDPGLPDPANKRRREVDNRDLVSHREDRGEDRKRLLKRGDQRNLRADAVDHVFQYGEHVDTPIAGDWNGDGIDQIGVFRGGLWLLDVDGDGRWTKHDRSAEFGRPGDEPVVGDFNGDEIDDIAIVRGDTWIIDSDGDGRITGNDKQIEIPRTSEDSQPIAGDWDGDGKDEPGYYDEAA